MKQQIALNVDCMEYMRTLPDKAFDLAIVDPLCMDFFRCICENFLLLAVARKGAKNTSNAKARGIVRVAVD